jgi:hypothetical protein
MSTCSGQVAQSSDDGQQISTGSVTLTNTSTLVKSTTSPAATYWACRFENVTVPAGATISAASLSVYCPSSCATSMDTTLYCNKVANPSTLSATSSYISGLASTSNTVTWNTALSTSAFNASPDISAIITELIGQGSWASGNSMLFVLHALSGANGATVENYDGSSSEAAELSITYTAASVPGAPSGLSVEFASSASLSLTWTQVLDLSTLGG